MRRNLGLRKRILLPMELLIVVVSLAIGVSVMILTQSRLTQWLDDKMADNANAALTEMDNWLAAQINLAICFSEDPDAPIALHSDGSPADLRFRETLLRAKRTTGIERIFICGPDGVVRASSQPDTVGKTKLGDRDYIQGALAGRMTVSEAIMSKVSQKPVIAVGVPLKEDGKVTGVLACILDLGTVSRKMIEPYKILDSGYIFMFDGKGHILAHPDEKLILQSTLKDSDWGQKVLSCKKGYLSYTHEGTKKHMYFVSSDRFDWGAVATVPSSELMSPIYQVAWTILLISVLAIVVGILLSLLTARSITGPLYGIIGMLDDLASQSTSASDQIAAASSILAEGADKQASALEETSASFEEISSAAKQNAGDASNAKEIFDRTRVAAESGAENIAEMNSAMEAIKNSSDSVREIVRKIDEIAFQTNILALNAAVEAARAGESGAGFAVVAEEVRNLAQRSATAAKETAGMIEESITRTEQGVRISGRVSQALKGIVEEVHSVNAIVTREAEASGEQDRGITEVSRTLESISTITRNNAQSAKECASAATEMSSQSARMREIVDKLESLVGKDPSGGTQGSNVAAKPHASRASRGARLTLS